MNRKQLVVMWVGIGIIVLATLFPFKAVVTLKDEYKDLDFLSLERLRQENEEGYDIFQKSIAPMFLFSKEGLETKINYGTLFLCHFVVGLLTIGLIVTFNEKKAR